MTKLKEVSCIIPIRDRENERLINCITSIRNNSDIEKIIVVDYNSKIPVKLPKELNVDTIRTKNKIWNKAHALNLGILKTTSKYVMTIDADMLISKDIFNEIEKNLLPDSFIIDTNVRRVKIADLSTDYGEMVRASLPWFNEDRSQFFNQANGGFQVYSREFFDKTGGIKEGLGFYMGAMDNYMYYLAKLNGLNIINVSYPLLHMEHNLQKERNFNLSKKEQDIALGYRTYKANYLDEMIEKNIIKNDESYGGKEPNSTMLNNFQEEYEKRNDLINKAIAEGKETVKICGQLFRLEKQKPSILICVINNYETMPSYFVWDLLNLFLKTKESYPDTNLQQVNACSVTLMRNLAVKQALGDNPDKKKYNYVVQLDTDHRYNPDFIVKFLDNMEKNKIPILTGLTDSQKVTKGKHYSTQYYKIQDNLNEPSNCVQCAIPKNQIIPIECSGPVGMVINTGVFKELEFPYYLEEYVKDESKQAIINTGSDVRFCKELKKKNIPIFVDLSTSFPHQAQKSFLDRGRIVEI